MGADESGHFGAIGEFDDWSVDFSADCEVILSLIDYGR
jgi:hypothetical protein